MFRYTGEGQVGDMTLTKGNRAIAEHVKDGRQLFLFAKHSRKGGLYRFLGEFVCAGYDEPQGHDKNQAIRKLIVFNLYPAESLSATVNASPSISGLPLADLRREPGQFDGRRLRNVADQSQNFPYSRQRL